MQQIIKQRFYLPVISVTALAASSSAAQQYPLNRAGEYASYQLE
jgi:hypothetical protein